MEAAVGQERTAYQPGLICSILYKQPANEVTAIGNPENRAAIQEEIAAGAAANCGNGGDDDAPQQIQRAILRDQHATHGEDRHAGQI